MRSRKCCLKNVFIGVLGIIALFLTYDLYNSDMYQCVSLSGKHQLRTESAKYSLSDTKSDCSHTYKSNRIFSLDVLDRDLNFDIYGNDVIVFLHIQKTGGTSFGMHLVKHLSLKQPCACIHNERGKTLCECNRPGTEEGQMNSWLFSRYSPGWECGLHADWTELNNCVPKNMDKKEKEMKKRRYFYITFLRHPTNRYISEWRCVQRGVTWSQSLHMCDGRLPTKEELPKCYNGDNWKDVTLNEFMSCKYNLANNRQTRMLADLALVGCYNLSKMSYEERNHVMLRSAKRNLRRLAFLGLTEHQADSQFLFEETFKLNFTVPIEQNNATRAESELRLLTTQQKERIEQLNWLDMDLYYYARDLFVQRKFLMQARSLNDGTLPF